jgi:hypothetical protein
MTDLLQPGEETLTFLLETVNRCVDDRCPWLSHRDTDPSVLSLERGSSVLTVVAGLLFFVICQGMRNQGNIQ